MDNTVNNMDTTIIKNEEEVSTWVTNNKKICLKGFFNAFQDIYDTFLIEVVKCKNIEEYVDLEKSIIKGPSASKPGKIPIRLNKPGTKPPAVYYFLSVFLIKYAGIYVDRIVEDILRHEETAAAELKRIEKRYSDLQIGFENLEKIVEKIVENNGDAALANGLKNEANNILWGKIKALEEKEETPTSQVTNMEIDNKTQKKKKRPNKKRNRARSTAKTGMITDIEIDKRDINIDYLEKHFAEKSHDITFYDVPAYWSDEEILGLLNANVGCVQYISFKRCYKYKTVRTTIRFSRAYEKIYKEGGVNVSLTRNNNRTYFIRMFDSHLPYSKVKEKFRWQAIKSLETDVQNDDILVIKNTTELDLMTALNKSIQESEIGSGLLLKKENDYINENGELQEIEFDRRSVYQNYDTRSNSFRMEWDQQDDFYAHSAPSRRHNKW
ncbi:hypothetical protein RhiirB3_451828 [Rhizophagus irregularis]|nr:hypothetical protein RhiirB3_451828 [Rhizophagus irregularis]